MFCMGHMAWFHYLGSFPSPSRWHGTSPPLRQLPRAARGRLWPYSVQPRQGQALPRGLQVVDGPPVDPQEEFQCARTTDQGEATCGS